MKVKKILISSILIILVFNIFCYSKTFAFSDIIEQGDDFLSKSDELAINTTNLTDVSNDIYNILLGVGIVVAVIVGAVLGIHFIFGSVEGKAKIMEALVPYIVGCFVVFGAFGIWKIAINAGKSISDEVSTSLDVDEQRQQNSEEYDRIENGQTDLMTISVDELKRYYKSQNGPYDDLHNWVSGNSGRSKGMTEAEAVAKLRANGSTVKIKIYEAAVKRGLVEDGKIDLK